MYFYRNIPRVSFHAGEKKVPQAENEITVSLFTAEDTLAYIKDKQVNKIGFALATINLDHAVKLSASADFLKAYHDHDAICADGFPIVWLGRLSNVDIRRTTGSDITLPLVGLINALGGKLAIVGTSEQALAAASQKLKQLFPDLVIAYTRSPSLRFDPHSEEAQEIIRQLGQSEATLCLLALGAPKQEVFAAEIRRQIPSLGIVSVGASIDFIAGAQKRAPRWTQELNLEWLWRLALNPRRLFKRYALCALIFPLLLAHTLRQKISGHL